VLSILSGVLFLAAGGVGTLFYLDHDQATKAASEQRTQMDDLRRQLEQTQADLDGLEEDYADLEADTERCTDAVSELLNATPAEGATQEELQRQISALVFDLIQACDVSVTTP
jgi:chromosome segregation ATPase